MKEKTPHEIEVDNSQILANKIIEMFVEMKASLTLGCMSSGLIICHSLSKASGKKEAEEIRDCIIEMMEVTIANEYND